MRSTRWRGTRTAFTLSFRRPDTTPPITSITPSNKLTPASWLGGRCTRMMVHDCPLRLMVEYVRPSGRRAGARTAAQQTDIALRFSRRPIPRQHNDAHCLSGDERDEAECCADLATHN